MDLAELPSTEFRRHPWEVARCDFYCRVLEDAGLLARPVEVLDAGAGDGFLVRRLLERAADGSRAVAWDAEYTPELLARLAATAPPELSFVTAPPAEAYDVVLLLDVLEHVPDDETFLRARVAANLRVGGHLLVGVPTWPALYTAHDRGLGHVRRYRPRALRAMLERAGLRIELAGGLFHSLLAPRALQRLVESVKPPADVSRPDELAWHHGAVATVAMERALGLDTALSRRAAGAGIELPGLSWWALCRRR
jgi:SAM-dependent methyltransferase